MPAPACAETSESRILSLNLPRRAGKITRMPIRHCNAAAVDHASLAAVAGTTVAKGVHVLRTFVV
jgi:hypothetical protein